MLDYLRSRRKQENLTEAQTQATARMQGWFYFANLPWNLGFGIAGVLIANQLGYQNTCSDNIAMPLLVIGATELAMALVSIIVCILYCTILNEDSRLIAFCRLCFSLLSITTFCFFVIGSVWTWRSPDSCRNTQLWFASNVFLIVAWVSSVLYCCVSCCLTCFCARKMVAKEAEARQQQQEQQQQQRQEQPTEKSRIVEEQV